MHQRIAAETTIGMVGAWDDGRHEPSFAASGPAERQEELEQIAGTGLLFFVNTNAVGSYLVDIYIDEPMPPELHERVHSIDRDFLLSIPSGRVVIGGVEERGATERTGGAEESVIAVLSGDYRLRCHAWKFQEDAPSGPKISEVAREILNREEYEHYRKVEKTTLRSLRIGCLLLLLFPALAFVVHWLMAASITLTVIVTYSYFHKRRLLRRDQDPNWRVIVRKVHEAYLLRQSPDFVWELHRLSGERTLSGGWVDLEELERSMEKSEAPLDEAE